MYDLQRLLKDIKVTQKDFSEMVGVSETAISRVKNGTMVMPNDWLYIIEEKYNLDLRKYLLPDQPLKSIPEDPNGKEIPFFNQEVYGTISPVLDDYITMQPYAIKKIPMFMSADGAVQVKGHSMKGYINNGDWIVIKKITNRNFIIYGEPYLVITKSDNLKTVKFVKESSDNPNCLTLTPYNVDQFEPQDIDKEEVLELYSIVGLFRSM